MVFPKLSIFGTMTDLPDEELEEKLVAAAEAGELDQLLERTVT